MEGRRSVTDCLFRREEKVLREEKGSQGGKGGGARLTASTADIKVGKNAGSAHLEVHGKREEQKVL